MVGLMQWIYRFSLLLLLFEGCHCQVRSQNLLVNVSRVVAQLNELSTYNDAKLPAVTRVIFTQPDVEARSFIRAVIRDSGLLLREDGAGNIFARLPTHSNQDTLEPGAVGTGSHYDAIPYSGKYDGTIGVLGAIEAVRALRNSGIRPTRPIEVLAFTSEEPTRFGKSCIGSRILVGQLAGDELREMKDDGGLTFDEARGSAGLSGNIEDAVLREDHYSAFVELHIEQGKLLEQQHLDIGIVTAIAGTTTADVCFEGEGGHAGGVLMEDRHDAVLAGGEFVLSVEQAALSTRSPDTVATCGKFVVEPGAENSIGRRVCVSLDVRDIDGRRKEGVVEACRREAARIGAVRGVDAKFEVRGHDEPALCSEKVQKAVISAVEKLGYLYRRMVSRAYHDSLLMARRFPTGMIFVPCKDGISHHWKEEVSVEHLEKGILTLAHTLSVLAGVEDAEPRMAPEDEL